jgi:NAD(P)H-dependent flavin oxidoreductase YrpB (nitropropane dioxygenase family)
MLTTSFTELVGCSVPIQQAGMAALATPRLAAAVANAGGLGMFSVYGRTPAQIAATLDEVRTLTTGVVGANFIMQLADVLIYCLSFANSADIDLSQAIRAKLERNETRFPVENALKG